MSPKPNFRSQGPQDRSRFEKKEVFKRLAKGRTFYGKPVHTKMNEYLENFRRGGVISDLKNFIAIFVALAMVILVMNFRKNFKKGGWSFPIRKISLRFFRKFWGCKNNEFSEKGGGSRQSE